jgi:hypothetical protein
MNAGIQFPDDAVSRHAAVVGEVSERMAQARSAVRDITMDSHAYGQLCQFLPSLLSPLFHTAADVMNDAVEALGETALKLISTSAAMRAADDGSAGRVLYASGPALELPL